MRHIFIMLFMLCTTAFAQSMPTHEFTLSNGLTVLVREDHRAPVATLQLWYKVGSSDEQYGNTGLSHLLEHMMFQGTKAYPEGIFSDIISARGGALNAFTSYDFTAYHESLPVSQIEIAFQLEADRMRNIDFTHAAFDKELQVVIEERRMRTEDNPQALAYERFQAVTFLTSPYHHPVIGWMADLNHLSFQSAFDWYNRWYHPNNATLIIVGDVDPESMRALADKYFGKIPKHALQIPFATPELPSMGEKQMDLKVKTALPALFMSLLVPSYTDPQTRQDTVVLALISQILDGGLSAQFETALVRQQNVAAKINADYSPFTRLSTTFEVTAVPQQGVTLDTLEQAIWHEMSLLTTTPVSAEALSRAKMQFKASDIFGKDDITNQAMEIGVLESIGLSYKDKDTFLNAIERVNASDIQTVAQRYFTRDNLTVARLIPTMEQTQ